jgi:hypothetical protein
MNSSLLSPLLRSLPNYSVTLTIDLSHIISVLLVGFVFLVLFGTVYYVKQVLFEEENSETESLKLLTESDTDDGSMRPDLRGVFSPDSSIDSRVKPKSSFRKLNTSKSESNENIVPFRSTSPRSRVSAASVDSAINTGFDLDEFLTRLLRTFFVISRIKDNSKNVKKRIMKMNSACELIFYKNYQEKVFVNGPNSSNSSHLQPTIVPSGTPYIKLPLQDLLNCVLCEEEHNKANHSFILEFKQKIIRLQCLIPVDNNYLIRGFQNLVHRLKLDKLYLDSWKKNYEAKKLSLLSHITGMGRDQDDDDNRSLHTSTTAGRQQPLGSPSTISTFATPNKNGLANRSLAAHSTSNSDMRKTSHGSMNQSASKMNMNHHTSNSSINSNIKNNGNNNKSADHIEFHEIYDKQNISDTFVDDVDSRLTRKRLSRNFEEQKKKEDDDKVTKF